MKNKFLTNELFYLQDEPRNSLAWVPPVNPFDQDDVDGDRQAGDDDGGEPLETVHCGHFSFKNKYRLYFKT
jgi:hypothetical protein